MVKFLPTFAFFLKKLYSLASLIIWPTSIRFVVTTPERNCFARHQVITLYPLYCRPSSCIKVCPAKRAFDKCRQN